MTPELAARIVDRRARSQASVDLGTLATELAPGSRQALTTGYAELSRLTTTRPDAWIVTGTARESSPAVVATIELRLVLAGSRAAIVRRKTSP
jgi:hypothetical protein